MNYWLMKSEPETFSIDDLIKAPHKTEPWEGVRNYQARNFMRDQMQKGDQAFFYHSNCKIPAIVGIMEIVQASHPDPTSFDPRSKYYDPKSTPEHPRWFMVSVRFVEKFKQPIPLTLLREDPNLDNLALVKTGNRLSVMPVSKKEWQVILKLKSK